MKGIDYAELGLKSGLEIHQQLDTKKLFCNCQSLLRRDEPDFVVKRRLHAVAGESGNVDEAARHEAEKDKEFVYQGYDTTCLVELDEEPPHQINQEALKIALKIALLLNCKIISLTQIMRKTVIDGSNTSGFQRTAMIAKNGYVETSQGKVGVDGVFLEEDSARLVEKKKDLIVYRLDRLGIPLVEIATAPDIKNAEHAKETALKIGEILRSCRVKRGIGTIRQDINISIKGGQRVELKGFQNPKIMIKTFENEVERQKKLVGFKKKWNSEVRNCLSDGKTEFLRPMPGASRMYPETDLPLLKISRELINECKKSLPKKKSEVESELKKEGLSEEMVKLLFKRNKIEEFREAVKILNKPSFVGKLLLILPREIARRKKISVEKVENIFENNLAEVLNLIKKNKISEKDVKNVFEEVVEGKAIADALSSEKQDFSKIEERVAKLLKEKPGLSANAYMGLAMKEFKGKVHGSEIMEIIKKYVK